MKDFRAALSDDTGRSLGEVAGTFYSGTPGQGPVAGEFEVAEDGGLLQGALEGKPFRLEVEGTAVSIRIETAEAGSAEGMTRVRFAST